MSKPSILIVPGSFALPSFYDDVINPLVAKGYEIEAIGLATVVKTTEPNKGQPPEMYEDAAIVANKVKELAKDGKEVILVAHSYGGVPAAESMKGLSKKERQGKGEKGGVVRIGYMTSVVPAVGQTAGEVLASVAEKNAGKAKVEPDEMGWLYQTDIPSLAQLCFPEILDEKKGESVLEETFGCHSSVSFFNKLTYAGYEVVPVSWLFCEDDELVPPKIQSTGIELIEKESGGKVDVTYIKSGHCPNISMPEKVVDWLESLVKKSGDL